MTQLVSELLHLDSTVPIGSIALGIANEDSDLDLCVLNSDLTEETIRALVQNSISTVTNEQYGDSVLLLFSTLYQCIDTDIFVFTDEDKLAIVHKVMYKMGRYPKFVIRNKWVRISIFRYLLEKEGFLDEDTNRFTPNTTT